MAGGRVGIGSSSGKERLTGRPYHVRCATSKGQSRGEDLELLPAQVALARRLFVRRLATDELPMRVTADEYAQLIACGATQLESVKGLLTAVAIELA
jgi:hypothetical protein